MGWREKLREFLDRTRGGLIVSCQSEEGTPFHKTEFMVAFALAAKMGGAVGIRTNGPRYIRAIRRAVGLPIIGIYKRRYSGYEVYITPTKREAEIVARAGADVIAIDATNRRRPRNTELGELIHYIKDELGLPVMADISTLEEGLKALELGADIIATTLSGYTEYTKDKLREGPDLELVRKLTAEINAPVIAEGRYWYPNEVCEALKAGAHAVVVGTAITRPHKIVERFVQEIKKQLT